MTKLIPLSQGALALVSDHHFDWISQYSWSYASGYATTVIAGTPASMHRLIMNAPKGTLVDHINQHKADNRTSNLRFATKSENALNFPKRTRAQLKERYSRFDHLISSDLSINERIALRMRLAIAEENEQLIAIVIAEMADERRGRALGSAADALIPLAIKHCADLQEATEVNA
jgi:hypothetical protein